MILEIRFSDEFLKAFKKLKKRYKSLPQDVNALIDDLDQIIIEMGEK